MDGTLFYDGELRDLLEHRKRQLGSAIINWNGDEFLQLSPADILSYLKDEFSLEAPQLDLEAQYACHPRT